MKGIIVGVQLEMKLPYQSSTECNQSLLDGEYECVEKPTVKATRTECYASSCDHQYVCDCYDRRFDIDLILFILIIYFNYFH